MIKKFGLLILGVVVLTLVAWGGLVLASVRSQPEPYRSYGSGDIFFPPYHSDADRMGFGKASSHDASILNGGWYLNWSASANPDHPGGAEYARVIILDSNVPWCQAATEAGQVTPSFTGTALIEAIQLHPGALWIIGNEPDSLYNGHPIQAELYAEFYHYFYHTIKTADPAARVSVAPIVQPSPLRMEYLDKMLSHYQATYSETLKTDLWNIHFYNLNEGSCGSWGVAVPPESSQSQGWSIPFSADVILDINDAETNLRAFRQWMADNGYRDIPLLISEYGVLPPPSYGGFENPVAAQFLNDTFNLFLTVTDDQIGYPADGNRLIQMWNWFSTYYAPYGGDLFEANNQNLTVIGDAFVDQTTAHFSPYIDLQVEPAATPFESDSAMIGAFVTNRGNFTATGVTARIILTDHLSQTILVEDDILIGDLGRRYAQEPVFAGHSLAEALPVVATMTVVVDPEQVIADVDRSNNIFTQSVVWYPELGDLAISNLSVISTIAGVEPPQMPALISTTITNSSNWTTTHVPFQMEIQRDGEVISPGVSSLIPPLAPGQGHLISGSWMITSAGLYSLTAIINPDNLPGIDFDPANNQAERIFELWPDVAISSLTLSPLSLPAPGSSLLLTTAELTVTVANLGNWPSSPTLLSWQIQDLSNSAIIYDKAQPLPGLLPAEQLFLTASWTITDFGFYQLRARVETDTLGSPDSNPENNEALLDVFLPQTQIHLPVVLKP